MNKTNTIVWLVIFIAVFVWSAINPKDQFTWFLEVAPALIALIVLAVTKKTYPLTKITYIFILIHCVILMVGGHYTYAEVPLFDYLKEITNSARNNYDKVGHFAQGFIPALVAREVLIRNSVIPSPRWRNFFIVSFCLALSAFYELIEWWVAALSGESADAFLGTQGYMWDTQSDMFLAMIGAITSLVLLSKIHDKQIAKLSMDELTQDK
ncbi:DUF2238 domain-containing protein [Grimontia sp. NTOU-MAR1]|uniref:DUF2238 domain-containing protein n=1 Tax=Grimontia sp. NTOU-MAR1 TaxID=3111011 RepID=UPI002DBA7B0A|nr:DUF2238 domain-containing protein [Grimontia sp. NTOU-MAR1]WRV98798.1 DUF2238 domain-containing protein [Grimontia sp. NTOU-MAR1]